MKRIVSPNGAPLNFETTVEKIQEGQRDNLKKRVEEIIGNYGINLSVVNGSIGSELGVSVINSGNDLAIGTGRALTQSMEYIKISSTQTVPNPSKGTNNAYAVLIKYKEQGVNPVKALNAFVYDKLGSQSLSRKTQYNDSWEIITEQFNTTLNTYLTGLDSETIALAVVWDSTGNYSPPGSPSTSTTGNIKVWDIREENRMLLSSDLLDEDTILFRDRDSVGSRAFGREIEFSNTVYYDNIEPASGAAGVLKANELEMTAGNLRQSNLEGTTAEFFYVQVGADGSGGKKLLIGDGELSNPSRLRHLNIAPSRDKNEHYSLVKLEWNWRDLDGTHSAGGSTVTFQSVTYGGDGSSITDEVIGKNLYFTSSNRSYRITGRSGDTITVLGTFESDDTSSEAYPLRIIDYNTKQYLITAKNIETGEVKILYLDSSFVKNPAITMKLELEQTYRISIQGLNQGGSSATTSTTQDLVNKIPNIMSDGTLSAEADAQGFNVTVSGWEDAHDIEIIYSSTVDLSDIATPFEATSGDVERSVLTTRTKHISSGKPKRFVIAARPRINKQGVAAPIFKEVVSGGGGMLPDEVVLMEQEIKIKVIETEVAANDPADSRKHTMEWFDRDRNPILVDDYFSTGRVISPVDGNGDRIPASRDYRIKRSARLQSNLGQQIVELDIDPIEDPIPTTTVLKSGISEEDRKIGERKLNYDYTITEMQVKITAVSGVSAVNGGIIRVFKKGDDAEAAHSIEVEGLPAVGTILSKKLDLPISANSANNNNIMVVDAFNPAPGANNEWDVSGVVTILGKPKVIENF